MEKMSDKKQRSVRKRLPSAPGVPISVRQQIKMIARSEPQQETEPEENPVDSKLSRFGETALHKAAINNDVEACRTLISLRADLNPVDNYGWTPLHEACNHGHYEVAELLIQHGADINKKSVSGTTPLIDAVINDHLDVIHLLLENGADVNAKDKHGQSALTHPYVCEYLRRHAIGRDDKSDTDVEEQTPIKSPEVAETSSVEVAAAATVVVKNESNAFVGGIDDRTPSAADAYVSEQPPESDVPEAKLEDSSRAEVIRVPFGESEDLTALREKQMSEEGNGGEPLSPDDIRSILPCASSEMVAAAVRTMLIGKWRERMNNPIVRNLPPLPGIADFKNLSAQYDWNCYMDSFHYSKRSPPDELPACSKALFRTQEKERADLSFTIHRERAELRWSFERQAAKIYNRLNGSVYDMTVQRFMRERWVSDPAPLAEDPPFRRLLYDVSNYSGLNPFSLVDLVKLMGVRKKELIKRQKLAAAYLVPFQRKQWRDHYVSCSSAVDGENNSSASATKYVYMIEVTDDFEALPSTFVENAENYERQILALNISF